MSEYKMRSGRRRRQGYAPYHTKKKEGLVTRMWNWLTPTSWWQTDPSPSSPSPSSSSPSPSSSPATNPENTPCSSKVLSQSKDPLLKISVVEEQKQESERGKEEVEEEEREVDVIVVENGIPDDEEEDDDQNTSWVAEDTDQVGVASGRGQTLDSEPRMRKEENPEIYKPLDSSSTLSPSLFQSGRYSGPPASAIRSTLRSRPLLTSTPQLSPVNEAYEQGHPRYHDNNTSQNEHHGRRGNTVTSRVPQQARLGSIPEQSSFRSNQSMLYTTTHTSFVSSDKQQQQQNYTSLSLGQSPFQSPFYSGRTSFGGAASTHRLKTVKRARRESSPPVLAPVQLTVRARPHPSAPPHSSRPAPSVLSSTTAQRILSTLDSLSSPLAEARKLPLRGPADSEKQPARKRHKSAQAVLSPPPLSSLPSTSFNPLSSFPPPHSPSTSSSATQPVLVPNEKTIKPHSTHNTSSRGQSSLLGATLRPGNTSQGQSSTWKQTSSNRAVEREQIQFSVPSSTSSSSSFLKFSSTPAAGGTNLSSLKFTAPPLPVRSPDCTKQSQDHSKLSPDRSKPVGTTSTPPSGMASGQHQFSPVFHTMTSSSATSSGGKMKKTRITNIHESRRRDNQEEEGPQVAMVPAVGLQMKSDKPIKFPFAQGLLSAPTVTSTPVVSMTTKPPPNFSFSTPKPVSSSSAPVLSPPQHEKPNFQFSAPTPAKPHPPTTPPQSVAPPLKRESVVDVLKRPDYQALTGGVKGGVTSLPSAASSFSGATKSSSSTIPTFNPPLSIPNSKAPPTSSSLPSYDPPSSTLPTFSPPTSSSSSSSSTGTDLKQSSTALPPLSFGLPAGGWECDTCLVQNTSSSSSCVACGTSNKSSDTKPTFAAASSTTIQTATASSSSASSSTAVPPASTTPKLLLSQFAAPSGSWECPDCMIQNKSSDSKCIACGAAKPGGGASSNQATEDDKLSARSVPSGGGLQLGSGGELKLPGATSLGGSLNMSKGGLKLGQSGGLKVGSAGLKFGLGVSKPVVPEGGLGQSGGLKLGEGGLKLGVGVPKTGGSTEGGLKLGSSGGFGESGGLKLGEGVKLGDTGGEGGFKLGSGGLKFGDGGGLKVGSDGGLKLGDGGLKFGGGKDEEKKSSEAASKPPGQAPVLGSLSSGGVSMAQTTETKPVSFSFGGTTTEQTKPPPPVVFGGSTDTKQAGSVFSSSTSELAKPMFGVGTAQSTSKPTVMFGGASESSKTLSGVPFGSGGSGSLVVGSQSSSLPPPSLTTAAGNSVPQSQTTNSTTVPSSGLMFGQAPPPTQQIGLFSSASLSFSSSAQSNIPTSSSITLGGGSVTLGVSTQQPSLSIGASPHTTPIKFGQSSTTSGTGSSLFRPPGQQSGSPFGQSSQQSSQSGSTGSTPSLMFGQSNLQTGQTGSSTAAPAFGQPTGPTSLTGSSSFGQTGMQSGSSPFKFGQSQMNTSSTAPLTFGQPSQQSTQPSPSLTFGQQTSQPGTSKPVGTTFSFGQSGQSTQQTGQSGTAAPSFNFGQPNKPTGQSSTSSTSGFNFGQANQQTGQPSLLGAAPTFKFGQQSTSNQSGLAAPSGASFNFGQSNQQMGQSSSGSSGTVAQAPFMFGGQQSIQQTGQTGQTGQTAPSFAQQSSSAQAPPTNQGSLFAIGSSTPSTSSSTIRGRQIKRAVRRTKK